MADQTTSKRIATTTTMHRTKPGHVFKISMKGIPVVTEEAWARLEAYARQPTTARRAYPTLPDII